MTQSKIQSCSKNKVEKNAGESIETEIWNKDRFAYPFRAKNFIGNRLLRERVEQDLILLEEYNINRNCAVVEDELLQEMGWSVCHFGRWEK